MKASLRSCSERHKCDMQFEDGDFAVYIDFKHSSAGWHVLCWASRCREPINQLGVVSADRKSF